MRDYKDKGNSDPTKLPRAEAKKAENAAILEQQTIELLKIFDTWERARPNLLKAEFEALRSCQKQYFAAAATSVNQFIVTSPGIPGGGLTVEEIADASGVPPGKVNFSAFTKTGAIDDRSGSVSDTSARYSTGSVSGASAYAASTPATTAPVSRAPPPPLPSAPVATAKMLYKFDGRSGDELSLPAGAIVSVLEKKPDGWYVGEYNGKKGLFPGNYSEEVSSSKAPPPPVPGGGASTDFTGLAVTAGINYAKENPEAAKKAATAAYGFAKDNPELAKKAAGGAVSAAKYGGGML